MKKFIYMAVAAMAALSSCSSDNDPIMGETGKQALTFTASMEGSATRAIYDSENKCAKWETTDHISINGKTYNAQSAGLTTTFKAATADQEAEGPTYNAYFACTYDGTTATLPAEVSETWADGQFNMPMYATSTTTDLQFHNLCGVLKITVKNDQIDAVRKIKVSSATKAISGAFTVDANNAAVLTNASTIANTLTVTYTDAVSTTAEGKVFYVAVPAQTYQELKIELDADGNGFTKSMTTKAATNITVERNKIYPITFADNAANPHLLSGSFSVASDKTVKFTKSNLYWSNTDGKFHFEAQPTDYPTTRETTHVGHFFWATTAEKSYAASYDGTGATTSDTFFADGNDGRTLTVDGVSGLYVLSEAEWTYLLSTRTNATNLRKWGVTVDDKGNCLVIAPDGFSGTIEQTYTLEALETAGLVCLPAAGYFYSGGSGGNGNYWSSTPHARVASAARYLGFQAGSASVTQSFRSDGYSLRAVLAE